MSAVTCQREEELLDALQRGFVGDELAGHVSQCGSCHELHLVAGALLDDRVESVRTAAVPSAGTMWWRMKIRQRQEALASTRNSLLIGQAATIAIALFLTVSLFGSQIANGLRSVVASLPMHVGTPLLIMVATWIILAPLAGYVLLRQK